MLTIKPFLYILFTMYIIILVNNWGPENVASKEKKKERVTKERILLFYLFIFNKKKKSLYWYTLYDSFLFLIGWQWWFRCLRVKSPVSRLKSLFISYIKPELGDRWELLQLAKPSLSHKLNSSQLLLKMSLSDRTTQ